jgi:hypothetical protein
MIFDAVANCDRLDCAFDIAIYEVIHLTQNKKPIPIVEPKVKSVTRDSGFVKVAMQKTKSPFFLRIGFN